jgi:hypothetical protein
MVCLLTLVGMAFASASGALLGIVPGLELDVLCYGLAGGLALLLPRAGGQVSAAESESATRSESLPLVCPARASLCRPASWRSGFRWRPEVVGSWGESVSV